MRTRKTKPKPKKNPKPPENQTQGAAGSLHVPWVNAPGAWGLQRVRPPLPPKSRKAELVGARGAAKGGESAILTALSTAGAAAAGNQLPLLVASGEVCEGDRARAAERAPGSEHQIPGGGRSRGPGGVTGSSASSEKPAGCAPGTRAVPGEKRRAGPIRGSYSAMLLGAGPSLTPGEAPQRCRRVHGPGSDMEG